MKEKHGSLSITSENIFPVIKKWLYSDHDIFLRELVSNACDAITKLKKLDAMGEFSIPAGYKPEVHIIFDSESLHNALNSFSAELSHKVIFE